LTQTSGRVIIGASDEASRHPPRARGLVGQEQVATT
jgi:hypothetical protein